MSVIKRMRKQKAVWWARGAVDIYGAFEFALPVEVACRWDGAGSEFRNAKGQTEMSDAVVYPDRVMGLGDKLQQGEIDSETPESPLGLTDAFEIKKFDVTPNFKATENLYTAYL